MSSIVSTQTSDLKSNFVNYNLPQELVSSVSKRDGVSMIANVLTNIRSNWKYVAVDSLIHCCPKEVLEKCLLVCASWYNHASLIDYIISKWKQQRIYSKPGFNPFMWSHQMAGPLSLPLCVACYFGNLQVVRLILKNISSCDKYISSSVLKHLPYWNIDNSSQSFELDVFESVSAVDMVFYRDNVEILKIMKDHVKCHWQQWLYKACIFSSTACLEFMLDNVPLVSAIVNRIYFRLGKNVVSPLMITAQRSYKATEILLDRHYSDYATINGFDCNQRTALHYAVWPLYLCYSVKEDELETLLTPEIFKKAYCHQCDVITVKPKLVIKTADGKPPRHIMTGETTKIIKLLLEKGCDHTRQGSAASLLNTYINTSQFNGNAALLYGLSPFCVVLCHVDYGYKSIATIPNEHSVNVIQGPIDQTNTEHILHDALECLYSAQLDDIKSEFEVPPPVHLLHLIIMKMLYLCQDMWLPQFHDPRCLTLGSDVLLNLNSELQLALSCLRKLLELSNREVSVYTKENSHFGILFNELFHTLNPVGCPEHGEQCELAVEERKLLASFGPMFTQFLTEYLKVNFYSGTQFIASQLEYIAEVSPYSNSSFMLYPVLCLLCSLQHNMYYTSVEMLTSNLIEETPGSDEYEGAVSVSKALKNLELEKNPRSLAQIARLAVYESMGRNWMNISKVITSKVYYEYLTSFKF